MTIDDDVKAWLYSGGDALVARSFAESTDAELAAEFIEACRDNTAEACPYSVADLIAAFAALREELT